MWKPCFQLFKIASLTVSECINILACRYVYAITVGWTLFRFRKTAAQLARRKVVFTLISDISSNLPRAFLSSKNTTVLQCTI